MKRRDCQEICEAASAGERRLVENQRLRYTGNVVGCQGENFQVEAFGHLAEWPMRLCEPTDGRGNPLGPPSNA